MPKRALPIQDRNMVYNEWGAIIAHQDEMDKAFKEQELNRNKNIQERY